MDLLGSQHRSTEPVLIDRFGESHHWTEFLDPDDMNNERAREIARRIVDGEKNGPSRWSTYGEAINEKMTGGDAYRQLANPDEWSRSVSGMGIVRGAGTEDAAASRTLSEAGVPGLKYLDAGSRAAGDGSRNYVTFRDDIVKILRKYGVGSISALPPAIQLQLALQQSGEEQPPTDF